MNKEKYIDEILPYLAEMTLENGMKLFEFVDREWLKDWFLEKLEKKTGEDIRFGASEFENLITEQMIPDYVSHVLGQLVDKGALDMSVGEDGEIYYKKNEDFDVGGD